MKFRYYIVGEGDVKGTDDKELAEKFSCDDDFWVIDADAGQYILMDTMRERFDIQKVRSD